MSPRKPALFAALAACLALAAPPAHAQNYPTLAPYPAIRWKEMTPEVMVEGKWQVLVSIDGIAVEKIVKFTQGKYGNIWQERFEEDLVQVLCEMGHPPSKAVKAVVVTQLVVRDPASGKEKTLADVPLTEENRESIRKGAPSRAPEPEQMRQALDELEKVLEARWSYCKANGADFKGAIARVRKKVDAGIGANDFGIELQKIIALGIDGHAGISGYRLAEGRLPFLIDTEGERLVAFWPDRSGFVDPKHPYVTKLDGKDLSEWMKAASALVPKGSPQYVRRNCLRELRDLQHWRGELGLKRKSTVEVELLSRDGKEHKTVVLPVAERTPVYGIWPRGGSRLLKGNIGYLRLASMDRRAVRDIKEWMPKFRDTAGLVVDVRDNGGGSRDALRLLHSYLISPDGPPRVINAAAYRLHKEHRKDHLAARFMYRADSPTWSKAERAAIAKFRKGFKPRWQLPKGEFSEWHYMVLGRLDDKDVYHYDKPVVVLMNGKCFSATDIFLAGLKGLKNVTLLGTPSGGGSARSQSVRLGETPFRARFGTMASFQADGKLFDGNGVTPEVLVEPEPEYYVGGRDNVLGRAVKLLKEGPAEKP